MNLQKYLLATFESWKPKAPTVLDRTKCSITLDWEQDGPFQFLADQVLYRLERNQKIPPWIVEYSGGKTTKLIDYLAPRHPYRFRLRVILKASAVTRLTQKALQHYGDETTIYDKFKDILQPTDFKEHSVEGSHMVKMEDVEALPKINGDIAQDTTKAIERVSQKGPNKRWLESQLSEETWTSTDTDGTSAICFCMAVRCGYTKQVQVMLEERPALVNIINSSNGFTPLATAVRKGNLNMVKYLISAGAEVDQPSSAGQTALHLAVLTRQHNIVEILLERGADFKKRDVNGLQVEHYAVDSCDVSTLRLVLRRGGDVAATDGHGWTPLFRALCQGASTDMVSELMSRGSDPDIKDNAGLPLTSVARLLKNRLGRSRDSILRLVDSQYPHEKAFANFTRLTKKISNIHSIFK